MPAAVMAAVPALGSHALGVKCGNSDATSGLVGNGVVGYVYDKLVAGGGVAMFAENTEIIGAEHVLAQRAANSIDFCSASVLEGTETLEEAGERLHHVILEIASGGMTKVETINHADPFANYYEDPIF
jgi:altronate dehydratase